MGTDSSKIEIWKPIPNYEWGYEVSNQGNIRSLDRYVSYTQNGCSRKKFFKGRILTKQKRNGYQVIALANTFQAAVHTIVMLTFVGKRPKNQMVCHNNGIKTDNRLSNLRYDSAQNNSDDSRKHGTLAVGERRPTSKLAEEQVLYIRDYVAKFGRSHQQYLAERFGVKDACIRRIVNRKAWKHV